MSLRFDAHSHLSDPARPGGADRRVICGTREGDWKGVLDLGLREATAIPMVGLHPWFLAGASPTWIGALEGHLRATRAGVGECGLDFVRPGADRPTQVAALRAQLRLAHALHRPVALHAVRAWGPLLDLLRDEGVPPAGAMVHDFGGSAETARALQSLGVFLSFSGRHLATTRHAAAAVLQAVEEPWLLLESDGRDDLPLVLRRAAALRGCGEDHLAALTWDNGQRCFREVLA